jgi:hypothetical protein
MYILPQYAIERKMTKSFIRTKVFIGIEKLNDTLSSGEQAREN